MREHSPLMTALAKLATPKQRECYSIPSIRDDRPQLTDQELASAVEEYDFFRNLQFPEDPGSETPGLPIIGICEVEGCGAHVRQTAQGTLCVNGHAGALYIGYAG